MSINRIMTVLGAYNSRLKESIWLYIFLFCIEFGITYIFFKDLDPVQSTIISINGIYIVYLKALLAILCHTTLLWAITSIPRSIKLRKSLQLFVIVVDSILFFTETFIINSYSVGFSEEIITTFLMSNPTEGKEFLDSAISLSSIGFSVLIYLFCCLVTVVIWRIYSYLKLKDNKDLPARSYSKLKNLLPLALVFSGLLLGFGYHWRGVWNRAKFYSLIPEVSTSFERLVVNTYISLHNISEMEKGGKSLSLPVDGLNVQSKVKNANIVLIIGESLSKGYMNSYGYPLENTPHMNKLIESGEVIQFSNVVSPAANTISSLSEILTLHTNEDPNPWYKYPSLPALFSQSGYWVQWTSNQERIGGATNLVAQIALSSDSTYFSKGSVNGARYFENKSESYDELLLPHLMRVGDTSWEKIRTPKENLMQIVHLMGNHLKYSLRYPESYNKFTTKDLPIPNEAIRQAVKDPNKAQNIADYVNSIYYNDYIVGSIIKQYENTDALVVYFSDHGQVLYEDPKAPDRYNHGLTIGALSVPLLVYFSPSMKQKYPELYTKVVSAKDKRIMLDVLSHSLPELLGISSKFSNPRLNIFSEQYDNNRPRIPKGLSKGQTIHID